MQLRIFVLFSFLASPIYSVSAGLEGLNKGINCDASFSSRPENEKIIIKNIGSTFSANNIDSGVSCTAWAGSEENNLWFELSSDLDVYGVNVQTKQYLGNWPLTHWPHYSQPDEILQRMEKWDISSTGFVNGAKYPVGCLANAPLRYGDIDSDTKNELVLFLGNDLVVFSPDQGKITFAAWLSLNDWYTLEDGAWYFEDDHGNDIKKPTDPQYESRLIHNRGPHHAHATGIRGYGKIFIGDFNNNQTPDIILWQKIYESKLESDPVRGFNLLRNQYTFFEKSENETAKGEYLPQEDTSPETVQGWLTANNLTWQKGFPSKSECAGQEGQLIPEMHDPLLNDPDVLK